MGRYILHSDLNNFYASVECLYDPSIRNKGVVVVGDEEKRHGIVLAKNYIAKDYGVKTGDTVWEARQKCGVELVCKPARFDLYLAISRMVKSIYREYSDRVESFGIDEAWIDVSHIVRNFQEAEKLADSIRSRIIAEIGLTVSIGVSFNKVFAKLASDLKKPNATVVITQENFREKVWPLPVSDLLYVGRATSKKFLKAGINTIGDLAMTEERYLKLTIGKVGLMLWRFANGLEDGEVKSINDHEEIKSIGNSTTCPKDLVSNDQVRSVIYMLAENVVERMRAGNYYGKVAVLFIKDNTLNSYERQCRMVRSTNNVEDLAQACYQLFLDSYDWSLDVRSVGVRITQLQVGKPQCDIWDNARTEREQQLDILIETLRRRFGYDIIKRGCLYGDQQGLERLDPHSEPHIIHPIGFVRGKL